MESYIEHGDCLKLMQNLPSGSIDMILCDLPYGQLNKGNKHADECDRSLNLDCLWSEYRRVIKDNGAIVLFASGMFTADLMKAAPDLWRYNLVWKKGDRVSGFLNAKRMPLRNHEDILIFYKKLPTYNPQMEECDDSKKLHSRGSLSRKQQNSCYGSYKDVQSNIINQKYPKSVLSIQPEHKDFFHPSQKPVELLEWLIKSYTNPGDLVLDNCMGSGSTCIACINAGRKYIGMELSQKYYDVAASRINNRMGIST